MADISITNQGSSTGLFGLVPAVINSAIVTWALPPAANTITVVKTPPTGTVVTFGIPITVQVEITNNTDTPYTGVVVTDILDPHLTYVPGTAEVNGDSVLAANVSFLANTLVITTLETIAPASVMEVTFQVARVS